MKELELIGEKFGDWSVISKAEDKEVKDGQNRPNRFIKMWLCECTCGSCGNIKRAVSEKNLLSGKSKSCGRKSRQQNGKNNKRTNKYIFCENYGIGLTRSGYEFYFDLDDYESIKSYCWHKHQDGYLRTRIDVIDGKNKYILMHNFILKNKGKDKSYDVDHINNLPFDNRKENLRVCKHSDNMKNIKLRIDNKTGVTGVTYLKSGKRRWKADIVYNGERIRIGSFYTKEEAIIARLKKEKKLFGMFSGQKHLYERYGI